MVSPVAFKINMLKWAVISRQWSEVDLDESR